MKKLKITSHAERICHGQPVKMAIFGPAGIGKTSLLKTLSEPTLCIDLEAGMLAVQDWDGDSIAIRTWEEARNIACLLGGPNPSLGDKQYYSKKDYERLSNDFCDPIIFDKYKCIFIDSITVASRLCFRWAQMQPEANRNGKLDTRAAYGILAREMTAWITQLQHITNKDIIMVGLLDRKTDDENKITWIMQCEGSKTALELPGIVDEVLCMVPYTHGSGKIERKFVCQALNSQEYPAKDRSGRLDLYEDAHLGKVLKKIKAASIENDPDMYVFGRNGNKKAFHKNKVSEYLVGLIETLDRPEKIKQFEEWSTDNKNVLDRFYKSNPKEAENLNVLLQIKKEFFVNENL